MPTHILGARLIDPANGRDEITDIYCQDGKIIALGQAPSGFSAAKTIDARGLIAAPGLVDRHGAEPGGARPLIPRLGLNPRLGWMFSSKT